MQPVSKRPQASRFVVGVCGFFAFLDLYATQPLLPLLTRVFHTGKPQVALTISAVTLAVALCAPFVGILADRIGRKPVIVGSLLGLTAPTFLCAATHSLHQLIFWRFIQGLFMPGIFAVTMAYVSEEWSGRNPGAAMSTYVSGTVLGGFSGRFLTSLVTDFAGWRAAFVVLGVLNLAGFVIVALLLPAGRRLAGRESVLDIVRAMGGHLRHPELPATFAVGFAVLFSLVATFTYITYYLSAAPFYLSQTALGMLFAVYLVGVVVTPAAGRFIDRAGYRRSLVGALLFAACGVLLTLTHWLPAVIAGLALASSGAFICQSAASSYTGAVAHRARSAATGMYVTLYYLGGSVGAVAPGLLWRFGGWPLCALLILGVQTCAALLGLRFWKDFPSGKPMPDLIAESVRDIRRMEAEEISAR